MTFETGSIITIVIFIAGLIYKAGHLGARVEELERYRMSLRTDMHEISDKIGSLSNEVSNLTTLIEERTDRRTEKRING